MENKKNMLGMLWKSLENHIKSIKINEIIKIHWESLQSEAGWGLVGLVRLSMLLELWWA